MMPASRHLDPVLGIDIHLIQPPGGVPPVPIPHPFIGVVFDAMDYVPIIGATVFINGLPRTQASTGVLALPHFPIGGMFIKPPGNEGEVFMGSATVVCDGEPLSYLAVPALSCQDFGIPAPFRLKKKPSHRSLMLPTSVVLAIPINVVVGGPPIISLDAALLKGALAIGKRLGKLAKKGFKKARDWRAARRARKGENGVKGNAGHPVDVVTGAQFDSFLDARSGHGLFCWRRHYSTARAREDGPMGVGFRHSYQHRLRLSPQMCRYESPEGRSYEFLPLAPGEEEALHGCRLRRLDGRHFELRHLDEEIRFELTADGRFALPTVIRQGERTVRLVFQEGRLVKLVDGEATYLLTYDGDGRIVELSKSVAARSRVLCQYAYSAGGCLVGARRVDGGEHHHEYDERRLMTRMRDPRGYQFRWRYDEQERCVETAGEDGLWWSKLEYAPERRQTVVTKGRGGVWTYRYDERGTIRERVDPHGGVLRREVDDEGRVLREVDAGGRIQRWVYDDAGAHLGSLDPGGRFSPVDDGTAAAKVPHELRLAETPRDQLWGSLAPLAPAEPPARREEWLATLPDPVADAARSVLCPAPEAAFPLRHDDLGRVIEELSATEGPGRRWRYDLAGNVVAWQDADGRLHQREITSWNLPAALVSGTGSKTRLTYNSTERPLTVVDGGGTLTELAWDEKDRLSSVSRAGALRDVYRYDGGDRLLEKRDGAGRLLLGMDYDEQSRLVRRTLASGEIERFAYDGKGRLCAASGPDPEVTLARDDAGRPLLDHQDGVGVQHAYRGDTHQTLVLYSFVVTHRRVEGGWVVVDPTGGEHRIETRPGGIVVRSHPGGTREVSQFDRDGHRTGRLSWRQAGEQIRDLRAERCRYSAAGYLQEVVDTDRGRTAYEIDGAGRLITVDGPRGRERYTHDDADNLIGKPGLGPVTLGPGNQLAAAGGTLFHYDNRQHLAERRLPDGCEVRYRYDALDRLVAVDDGRGAPWTASYDGLSRRLTAGRGEARRRFFWDGERLAAEVASDGRTRVYVYASPEALVPLLFVDYRAMYADAREGSVHLVFTSQQGMPERVEDDSGRAVWSAEPVDAYGALEVAPGSEIEVDLRWPGHHFDRDTGLHYNRYRDYDPGLGRYLQTDPWGLYGGLNVYAAPSNPLARVDVTGLHSGGVEQGSPNAANREHANTNAADGGEPHTSAPHPHDEEVVTFTLKRRGSFRKSTKNELRERSPALHIRTNSGLTNRVRPGLDRRHVVPNKYIAGHIASTLSNRTVEEAAAMLERVGVPVKEMTPEGVQQGAQQLLNDFDNHLDNLWVGDAGENRAIKDNIDPNPDWSIDQREEFLRGMRHFFDTFTGTLPPAPA